MSKGENSSFISSAIGYFKQVASDGFRNYVSSPSYKKPDGDGENTRSIKSVTYHFENARRPGDDEKTKLVLAMTQKGLEIFKRIPQVPPMLFRPKGFGSALWILGRYAGGKYTRYATAE